MSNVTLSDAQILERFAGVVARSLHIEQDRVTPDAYLSDLGAESLDLLEITMEAEDEFAILMPQKDILNIGQDVFGENVLVDQGLLTEQGVKFLRRRWPDLNEAIIHVGAPIGAIAREFQRVGTWVRMIKGLLEYSPNACPSCGAALAKPVAGRSKCTACPAQVDLPAGDDLNRRWVEEYFRSEQQLSGEGAQVA
jgi:acyl carrier protein